MISANNEMEALTVRVIANKHTGILCTWPLVYVYKYGVCIYIYLFISECTAMQIAVSLCKHLRMYSHVDIQILRLR